MKLSGRKQGHLPVEAYISPEWFERKMRADSERFSVADVKSTVELR